MKLRLSALALGATMLVGCASKDGRPGHTLIDGAYVGGGVTF